MKNIVLKNGLLASAVLLGITLGAYLLGLDSNYDTGEVIGYSAILLSMIFIFLGIREYRNKELNGKINFGKALVVGLLIALIPAAFFGIYNVIHVEIIDPEFNDKYFDYQLAKMKDSMDEASYESASKDMIAQKEMFTNTGVQFFIMFLTVFILGLITSIVSSIILKSNSETQIKTA